MKIYRRKNTGRLVSLVQVSPMKQLGRYYEEVDFLTGEVKRLSDLNWSNYILVGEGKAHRAA